MGEKVAQHGVKIILEGSYLLELVDRSLDFVKDLLLALCDPYT